MNRDALQPVALAAVCALAIVFASATLTSTVETGGEGVGSGGGSGVGHNEGDRIPMGGKEGSTGLVDLGDQGEFKPPICLSELKSPALNIAILVLLGGIGYSVKRQSNLFVAFVVVTVFALPLALGYAALSYCVEDGEFGMPEILSGQPAGSGGNGGAAGESATTPVPVDVPMVVYVLLAVGVVLVVAAALSRRNVLDASVGSVMPGRVPDEEDEPEPNLHDLNTAAVGRAAGRAADRIEVSDDVDNEVYRAWVEMTRHLQVDHPESSTPAEFASAATSAGMDRSDVDELTELFEGVRYGGRAATDDREQRALDALRRIEDQYAEANDDEE